jgi:hypothetical protein
VPVFKEVRIGDGESEGGRDNQVESHVIESFELFFLSQTWLGKIE